MRSIASLRAALFAICALLAAQLAGARVQAAELLMFEEDWCHWCQKWDDEVGVIYAKTEEGRRLPLRRVDIHGAFPKDVALTSRPQYTPTFILVDEGQEVGRIEGYPGEDFFWGLLGRLIDKLPASEHDSFDGRGPVTN
ncbi:MAG: thioredoxin family protein [Pseudomonadota bacterium]